MIIWKSYLDATDFEEISLCTLFNVYLNLECLQLVVWGILLNFFVLGLVLVLVIVFIVIVIILLVGETVADNVESVHDFLHLFIELGCWIVFIISV